MLDSAKPPHIDAMVSFVKSNAIKDWQEDAFQFPLLTVVIATAVASITESIERHNGVTSLGTIHISGEVCSVTGFLLSFLLIRSSAAKIGDWAALIEPYVTAGEAQSHYAPLCTFAKHTTLHQMILLICSAIVPTAAIASVKGLSTDTAHLYSTYFALANIMAVVFVMYICMERLYRAKQLVLEIHRAYMQRHFTDRGNGKGWAFRQSSGRDPSHDTKHSRKPGK